MINDLFFFFQSNLAYLTLRPLANFAQTAAKSFISKNIFGTDSLYGTVRGNGS